MRATALAGLAAVAALAAGCSSQWFPGYATHDIARTDVIVRTEPSGAAVLIDGAKQIEVSPVRIPVEYDHTETLYERQSNYGQRMREGMSPVVQIVTFPVWMIASFFHYAESVRRQQYGNNVHVLSAYAPGYDEAEERVVLEGEADHPVMLKLDKLK